jgi:solute carrier family 39 (zinc transporter), member 7
VRRLTELKEELEEDASKLTRQVFSWLFPFGPAWNSVLGTFYISSFVLANFTVLHMLNVCGRVPNMILAFIPAEIRPNTLNTMTAFAVRPTPCDTPYYLNLTC